MKHDKIKVLTTKEQAREKISIWFGSSSNYYHPLKEVVANACDEIINNFENGQIEVELKEDNQTLSILDTGRGIQIDGETNGIKNYELLFRTLFAGTKYTENEQTTTGTNGVGNTVINYTSSFFKVISKYEGFKYSIIFENGGEISQELSKEACNKEEHGTQIIFKLDPDIYTSTIYNKEIIKNILNHFAVSSPKIKIYFKYINEVFLYYYENSKEYFENLVNNQVTSDIFDINLTTYNDNNEVNQIKLYLTTTSLEQQIQESYLNLTYLEEGGSFNEGILNGIKLYCSKYCKSNNLFPKDINSFSLLDVENSVSFLCINLSNKVEFSNQTKLSTNKQLYKDIAKKQAQLTLEIFKTEKEEMFKKFINHLLLVQKHNTIALKAKQNLKKKLTEKITINNRIEKLVDCKIHNDKSELFIAEGDSALGSVILARDATYQAAYALRGKILNCLKSDYNIIFKNQIILDLVRSLGCGIETDRYNKDLESFNINNLRYGKIILASDQDADGFQIRCLVITMFYRLMPTLLKQGYIYIVQTPLYEVKTKNKNIIYYYSEQQKDKELLSIKTDYTISRVKGLGELDAKTMYETATNAKTRNLIKITIQDAKEMTKVLENWMGLDVSYRKEYISNNLNKYINI